MDKMFNANPFERDSVTVLLEDPLLKSFED